MLWDEHHRALWPDVENRHVLEQCRTLYRGNAYALVAGVFDGFFDELAGIKLRYLGMRIQTCRDSAELLAGLKLE